MSLFENLKLMYEKGLYSNVAFLASVLLSIGENDREALTFRSKYQTFVFYADALFHCDDYRKAQVIYKKALQLKRWFVRSIENPESFSESDLTPEVNVRYQLHLCHVHLKEYAFAIDALIAIPEKQRTVRVNMALGDLYFQTNMERSAIAAYTDVLKDCPLAMEAADRLLNLGVPCIKVAELILTESLHDSNREWLGLWLRALWHVYTVEIDKTISLLKQIEAKTFLRDNIEVLVLLGKAYYYNGDFPNAMATLERVHGIDPLQLKGMDVYAVLLAKEGKAEELDRLSSQITAINENAAESWIAMAYFCCITEKLERAVGFAQKACILDPRNIEALLLKGSILLTLENIEDAITHFTEACRIAPYRYDAHKGLVDCYLVQHNTAKAVALATEACQQLRYSARALTLCASAVVKDPSTIDNAKHLLESALEQDPTYLKAVYQLASIYDQEQMYEKGIELLTKQVEQQTTCRLHQMLGDFFAKTDEHEKALHHFSLALNLDPTNDKALEGCQRLEQKPESDDYEIEFEDLDIEAEDESSDVENV